MPRLPEGVELLQTCRCCPEQYDMFIYGQRAAYFRLRWGRFEVACPYPEAWPYRLVLDEPYGDGLTGEFDPKDRDQWLGRGIDAVLEAHLNRDQG